MASEPIETFLGYLRDCEQQLHIAEETEKECDGKTQDILHSLELEQHTYHQYAKLSKELAQVRRDRRAAKDTRLVLTPIVFWMSEHRAEIKSMERMLGDVRKAERRLENRVYIPRAKESGT